MPASTRYAQPRARNSVFFDPPEILDRRRWTCRAGAFARFAAGLALPRLEPRGQKACQSLSRKVVGLTHVNRSSIWDKGPGISRVGWTRIVLGTRGTAHGPPGNT